MTYSVHGAVIFTKLNYASYFSYTSIFFDFVMLVLIGIQTRLDIIREFKYLCIT